MRGKNGELGTVGPYITGYATCASGAAARKGRDPKHNDERLDMASQQKESAARHRRKGVRLLLVARSISQRREQHHGPSLP